MCLKSKVYMEKGHLFWYVKFILNALNISLKMWTNWQWEVPLLVATLDSYNKLEYNHSVGN